MYEDERLNQGGVMNDAQSSSQNGASNGSFVYGQQSTFGTQQYNQRSYEQTQQNPYGQQNTYGYSNTSYSYNPGAQQTYGTYQYGNTVNSQEVVTPVKKKNFVGKFIAAVAIMALVVGGVAGSYYVVKNRIIATDILGDSKDKVVAETEGTEVTNALQTEETQQKVKTTTVSSQTQTVVTDVTQVVAEVMPAMVMIHNNYTQSASFFGYTQTQEATASGSGIIVGQNDKELLIATNHHVINGADSLEVIFDDDTTIEAVVKGSNEDMDLAVISVMLDDIPASTMENIKVATLGDSDALVLGEPAIAIGNALGYGQSVTTGVISALKREVTLDNGSTKEFIQTDAPINPGNSGGALLNIQGEVIGINSNKIGGNTVEGMGYAIPISEAKPIIEELMNAETRIKLSEEERGYIGIKGVTVTSDISAVYGIPQGVLLVSFTSDEGASIAGLEEKDVIVSFNGEEISSMDDLHTKLMYYPYGDKVTIGVLRQNGSEYEEYNYEVTLIPYTANTDSSSSNESGNGQYDGQQSPAMPRDNGAQPGEH